MARDCSIGRQRAVEIAVGGLQVAELVQAHRQVALPAGVARVGVGEALADSEDCS